MERKALGKGISALIPDKEEGEFKVINVQTDLIKPNPFQPRENFDTQSLEELTQSIKEKGFIQPILARRQGDNFELIAGERRLRAAQILNIKEVPVIIKEVTDEDSLELALIENIQRQDLNPIEEARAYKYLIEKFGVTQERLSEILGKSRTAVTNTLRLLKLPQEIQDEIKKDRISFAHGRLLVELEDENEQRRLVQEVIAKSLSVRELESVLRNNRPRKTTRSRLAPTMREPYLAVIEEELQCHLGTKVRISKKKKRGNIVVEFYSLADLERIVGKMKGASIP